MSYTKTTWQNGDIITAEKLNHIEDGVASGDDSSIIVVTVTKDSNTYTADKTYQEARNVIDSGGICIFKIMQTTSYDYFIVDFASTMYDPLNISCSCITVNSYSGNKIMINKTVFTFASDNTFTKTDNTYFVQTTTP